MTRPLIAALIIFYIVIGAAFGTIVLMWASLK